jgi:hypothetical protein
MGKRAERPSHPAVTHFFAMASPAQSVAAQHPSSLRAAAPASAARRSAQIREYPLNAMPMITPVIRRSPLLGTPAQRFDVDNTSPDSHVDARIIATLLCRQAITYQNF